MSLSPPSLLSFPRPTHLALLPGRGQWLHVCHPNPVQCDDCMRRVAEFLAREMQYELERALGKSTAGYRAELGEDVCSMERAADLRAFTCQICLPKPGADLGLHMGVLAERNWMEQMRLAREFDRREALHAAEKADFLARQVIAFPARDGAQEEGLQGEAAPFPAPSNWARWRRWTVNCLMWTALIGVGGILFAGAAVIVLVAAFGGEEL